VSETESSTSIGLSDIKTLLLYQVLVMDHHVLGEVFKVDLLVTGVLIKDEKVILVHLCQDESLIELPNDFKVLEILFCEHPAHLRGPHLNVLTRLSKNLWPCIPSSSRRHLVLHLC